MRSPTALIRAAAAAAILVILTAAWVTISLAPTVAPADTAVSGPPPLDRYGGVAVRVAEATGYFQVKKIGNRWVFVTPDGNAFWMLGVFNVTTTGSIDDLKDSYYSRVQRKYGGLWVWGAQTVKRLRSWGFNTLAEYAPHYVLPTPSPYGRGSNPEKMPFVMVIRPAYYGMRNTGSYAPGPFKDLIVGTDPAIYTGWRGNTTPDVFDPNFDAYIEGMMRLNQAVRVTLNSPWLLGITADDADNVVGFGPGPEVPAARMHPHIGWLVLVTDFEQEANSRIGVTYADAKVYSKYALRDFLEAKYGTVAALNAAWGSTYTTFDSSGGWPSGRGLLDESGRNPWVGNDFGRLSKAAKAVAADLDAFLYEYAKKYFSVTSGRIRQHAPKHLVFGPATYNAWGGLTRKEILRATGDFVDVLQSSVASQDVLDLTFKYSGGRPLVTWTGLVANPDSSLWRYPNPTLYQLGVPTAKTQHERGWMYAALIAGLFDATTVSGVKPIVGTKFWSFIDSWGEKQNWGLVSFLDNAYDGKEATKASGTDPWGYRTGGEERDYGDFISETREGNLRIQRELRAEIEHQRQPGGRTPAAAQR